MAKWLTGALTVTVIGLLAGCGSSGSSGGQVAKGKPVVIGASLSLSGDFSADGQAFERGYKLWAHDQNAKGGLMGHKVNLEVLSDASSPAQVNSNYQKLIG